MDLLAKARKLESTISRTLDGAVEGFVGRSPRQPVEIVQAVLDSAEQQIQPAGRGTRVFPFNQITLHVLAPSRSDKARFAAVADGPPPLAQRVTERLKSTGCAVDRLEVQVLFAPRAKPDWLAPEHHIVFDRVDLPAPIEAPPPAVQAAAKIELSVVSGSAQRPAFTFSGERIDIGRRAEVLDHRQHLIRMNHIAFTEGDNDVNRTVSRRHAHIAYTAASREYRVHDDGSSRGTAILRGGQTVRVPQGSRGIRLESGDEIALGEARLRVKIR
ncbi:MAG: FHA domain-containing protein [Vicinamibacterales bacterium]